jgi:glycine hydroxymethyltransferase
MGRFILNDHVLLENSVAGDASAQTPGGIRLGTSALTSRDMLEDDIKVVADFLHRSVQIALTLQKEAGTKMLKDFVTAATTEQSGKVGYKQVQDLRKDVREFARKWPLPGVDVSGLQRPVGIEADD